MACLILTVVLCTSVCSAQGTQQTDLSCANVNNTSESGDFQGGGNVNARAGNVSKLPIRSLLYTGSHTRIFTRYMPWFGDTHHRDVGYRSDDREQIVRQVDDMASRGIEGAIVDWYGPDDEMKNRSTVLLKEEAERHEGFKFAISEDAGSVETCIKQGCDPTGKVVSDLKYAAQHFEPSRAYLRFEGRPAVFFFGLEKYPIDWHRIRQALPVESLLFFRNSGSFGNSDADGAYSWIAPETVTSADPMGLEYLTRFYSKAQHSEKIAMGSAYKGFNDSGAAWGKGRIIDQNCGQTWLTTFSLAGRFYSSQNELRALIIPTWNDYEEGTEIESGVDNCVEVKASVRDDKLVWSISGRENTIDHYTVLAQNKSRWEDVAHVGPGSNSIALKELALPAGTATLCVQPVGKPAILNHFSEPVRIPSK
jgi:hypothetical protein